MKCDTCELRFECLTAPRDIQPKRILGINKDIAKTCEECKNFEFKYSSSKF